MKRPCLAAFLAGSLIAFAAHAQDTKKPEPGPGVPPDPQIIENMMTCLAEGLTKDWKKAWFVVKEIDRNTAEGVRQFEADFFFATNLKDNKGRRLQTCGPEKVIQGVSDLNDYLTKEQQSWTSAVFTFTRDDGKYDVKYDYTPFKPKAAAADPADKPAKSSSSKSSSAAKKKQEPAK